ncbi:Ribonuclease P protein component 4 [Orchesella cincta]|uniref:Ribonuclease P protein component 4 n=1 Tax=Orchesella cincta TaxID=48709 RepID=A0A1D2N2G7_ORCCI|nr:Ribonuclease P protein component 4 [Orchesella cincta]
MGKVRGRGDEHACRVNYLFQASKMVAKVSPALGQYYGGVITVITDKTAANKDFTMKRSLCKKCHVVLTIGVNATYRLRKNKRKKRTPNIVITCTLCGEQKRLPTNRGYQLKAEAQGKVSDGRQPTFNPSPQNANSPAATSTEVKVAHGSKDEKSSQEDIENMDNSKVGSGSNDASTKEPSECLPLPEPMEEDSKR